MYRLKCVAMLGSMYCYIEPWNLYSDVVEEGMTCRVTVGSNDMSHRAWLNIMLHDHPRDAQDV